MATAILILICFSFLIFAGFAFYVASKEKKELKELEKEVQERTENVRKLQEANQTKADSRTGDHKRDFNYMADKLHDYAKK